MRIAGKEMTGAIFDVDGTLLDSMGVWENVGNDFLLQCGITPRENLAETFKTMSLKESAAYYQENYGIKKSEEEIIAGIDEIIRQAYEKEIPLKEGVKEFLSILKEENILMYIATATDRPLIEAALYRTGIAEYFNGLLTCSEVGKSKENPLIYEEARRRLGTKKETTWIIEDAYHAVVTAKAAGYPVLGVYDSFEGNGEGLKNLADVYCHSLNEVRGGVK